MKGLAWNYVEPTPIESSGLVASNIQASQQGLATGMAGLQQLSDMAQSQAVNQQHNERVQNLPIANTPNTVVNPIHNTQPVGLVNKTVEQPTSIPVQAGNGLVRPPTEAAKAYMGTVQQAAKAYGVPEDVILAVMQTESGFRPNAVSATGVKGVMQVTQDTYKGLGFTGNRSDPTNSINAGTKLLSQLYRQYGNWDDAFIAYNGGGDGVTGIRNGNWGVWANNPAKQKEISNYASTVNKYRTGWNKG